MRTLEECRQAIDRIDREIVRLFEERMSVAQDVAAWKIAHDLPVLDASREQQVLAARRAMLENPELAEAVTALYECIMAQSRKAQTALLNAAKEEKP